MDNMKTETFVFRPPEPGSLKILGRDSKLLAELKPDGTLVVDMEDATEAARVFWEAVRGHMEAAFARASLPSTNGGE